MISRFALLFVLLVQNAALAQTEDCGLGAPCSVENGDYYLSVPDGWDGNTALPALLFFHGHNSSGESVLKGGLRRTFNDAGYLVIAPNGVIMPGRGVRAWPARKVPAGWRDDVAFVLDVMADVEKRFPIDRNRLLVSGFSAGGSMAWLLACEQGQRFAGFASIAGALRQPAPSEECSGGPVRMLQIHGFTDNQVPLEGRQIRDWHQGDVFESLARQRAINGCQTKPTQIDLAEPFRCRIWTDCSSDRDIQLCMHDGGHGLPPGWAQKTLEWFEQGPPSKVN